MKSQINRVLGSSSNDFETRQRIYLSHLSSDPSSLSLHLGYLNFLHSYHKNFYFELQDAIKHCPNEESIWFMGLKLKMTTSNLIGFLHLMNSSLASFESFLKSAETLYKNNLPYTDELSSAETRSSSLQDQSKLILFYLKIQEFHKIKKIIYEIPELVSLIPSNVFEEFSFTQEEVEYFLSRNIDERAKISFRILLDVKPEFFEASSFDTAAAIFLSSGDVPSEISPKTANILINLLKCYDNCLDDVSENFKDSIEINNDLERITVIRNASTKPSDTLARDSHNFYC